MAQLDFDFDLSFLEKLGSQAEIEQCACKMIDEAMPIVEKRLSSKYAALGQGRLANKLKIVKAKPAKGGGYIGTVTLKGGTGHTYRKGNGKYPLSNAGLAVFLEYGTVNNSAYHCIGSAIAETRAEVEDKMQEVFKKEMGLE